MTPSFSVCPMLLVRISQQQQRQRSSFRVPPVRDRSRRASLYQRRTRRYTLSPRTAAAASDPNIPLSLPNLPLSLPKHRIVPSQPASLHSSLPSVRAEYPSRQPATPEQDVPWGTTETGTPIVATSPPYSRWPPSPPPQSRPEPYAASSSSVKWGDYSVSLGSCRGHRGISGDHPRFDIWVCTCLWGRLHR